MLAIVAVLSTSFAFASPANADEKLSRQAQQLLAMTPDDFARTTAVTDDDLEVTATITTQPGFSEKRGLLRIVWNDNFLRAFVDKKTGATTFQLYQRVTYTDADWRYFNLANYETPDGPKSVPVTSINRSVDCGSSRLYGGCTYSETIAVPIDEVLLRAIAAKYAPGAVAAWKFKFKSQSGKDFNDGMTAAEVSGMLIAVDRYRTTHRLSAGG